MRYLKMIKCYKVRDGSNHDIWYSPVTNKKIPVPRHPSEELKKGTEENIRKQSGLK